MDLSEVLLSIFNDFVVAIRFLAYFAIAFILAYFVLWVIYYFIDKN